MRLPYRSPPTARRVVTATAHRGAASVGRGAQRLACPSVHRTGRHWVPTRPKQYARAVFSSRIPELPREGLELRVRHRMQRKVTLEGPAPTRYEAVVHEAAFRIRVSGRSTPRARLARPMELAEADHVTVRATPFDQDDFGGTWNAMMPAGGAVPKLDTATRDAPHGTGFVDSEAQLGFFRTSFRRVEAASLDPERSRDFIHRPAKAM